MPVKKKKKDEESSPSGRPGPSERGSEPGGKANPAQGRRTRGDEGTVVDERAIARKNTKPRSARESLKGPNDRKASPLGKSAKS